MNTARASKQTWRRLLLGAVALTLLSGCAQDMDDLKDWVAEIKSRPAGEIPPLPEIEPYESFTYSAHELRSPFTPGRAPEATGSGEGPRPDPDRPREPLEAFSLDALAMVGTFTKDGKMWGLVRDPEGIIHRVQPGNYMGRNHGKILKITPSEIILVELVPDGTGGWMKREASLALETE